MHMRVSVRGSSWNVMKVVVVVTIAIIISVWDHRFLFSHNGTASYSKCNTKHRPETHTTHHIPHHIRPCHTL